MVITFSLVLQLCGQCSIQTAADRPVQHLNTHPHSCTAHQFHPPVDLEHLGIHSVSLALFRTANLASIEYRSDTTSTAISVITSSIGVNAVAEPDHVDIPIGIDRY